MTMTRFEFFEKGIAFNGFKIGVVSVDVLIKYNRYKTFLEFLEQHFNSHKGQEITPLKNRIIRGMAIKSTCKECRCHESTLSKDIMWFEGKKKEDC